MALPVNFNVSALIEGSGGKGGRAQHGRPGYPPRWRGREESFIQAADGHS